MKQQFSKEMKKSLDMLGYHTYTKVQEEVLPLFMSSKNVVVKSKTGSGKTAAFAIPIIEKINWDIKHPQALILTCTRELAMQIKEECEWLGKFKKMKVQHIIGKEKMENQIASLKQQCHIVVATPGRLLDLIQQNAIVLDDLRYIVLDEADYMLELGFLEDVDKILESIKKEVQIGLFSATYPPFMEALIHKYVHDPIYVSIDEKVQIDHYLTYVEKEHTSLYAFLTTLDVESAMVFAQTKEEVEKIYHFLKQHHIPCARIHGDLKQKVRTTQLASFKKGEVNVLVCSDVAARGIDVHKVSHIFHIGEINNVEKYIHRCGRSGRMHENGCSIILANKQYDFLQTLQEKFILKEIQTYQNKNTNQLFNVQKKDEKAMAFQEQVEKLYINAGSEKKIRPMDIIGALCSIDGVSKDDIGVIEVLRRMSYVEIYHHKANRIVEKMQGQTIKKKKVKVEIAQ